ncbi:MAG: Hsp20/alpha crystallin family protein [Betaproteobacteria bacterium]|nr:Hsp20/alpha crystallin family protein [Betaproteobacteria bacterium]
MLNNIIRRDPFGDVLDDVFKGFFGRPLALESGEPVRRMAIEVTENDGAYNVTAELPGVKKDDIRVTIEGDQVSVSAETRTGRETKQGDRIVHSERYVGKIMRTFRLGQEIDEAAASAKYADGVLELVLPKKAVAGTRQLTIQ